MKNNKKTNRVDQLIQQVSQLKKSKSLLERENEVLSAWVEQAHQQRDEALYSNEKLRANLKQSQKDKKWLVKKLKDKDKEIEALKNKIAEG